MKNNEEEYYVYVYIDPRNFEEFYYGQGKGNRKKAHLSDDSDSEKSKRIKAIQKAGLNPIIKVISKDLSKHDALLIEKTLLWKLGRTLTNKSSGHFADKFRPHDTFHEDLTGFDFKNGIYYVNVGEGNHRCWEDCKELGFLSAGQDKKKWSDPIRTLEPGDIVIAYLKKYGYVGVGRVLEKAVKVIDFRINGKSLKSFKLKVPNIFQNCDNDKSEYPVKIEWIKTFERKEAKWQSKSGLFTTQQIRASLFGQPKTIDFVQKQFNVDLINLVKEG
jgi:hypothetical protein